VVIVVVVDIELQCWSSWTEGEWTFLLLARLHSPPQFVLVSNCVEPIQFLQ